MQTDSFLPQSSFIMEYLFSGLDYYVIYHVNINPLRLKNVLEKLGKNSKYVEFTEGLKSEAILETYLEFLDNGRCIEMKENSAHLYPAGIIVWHKLFINKTARIFIPVYFLTVENGICENGVAVSEVARCHASFLMPEQRKFRNTNTDKAFVSGVCLEDLGAIFDMVRSVKELIHPAVVIEINSWLIAAIAADTSRS